MNHARFARQLSFGIGSCLAFVSAVAMGASPTWLPDVKPAFGIAWQSGTRTRSQCSSGAYQVYDANAKRCGSVSVLSGFIKAPGFSVRLLQRDGITSKLSSTQKQDTDLPGNDLQSFTNVSGVYQCRYLCSSDTRCEAFAYSQSQQKCWLKDEISLRVSKPGITSGYVPKPASFTADASMADLGGGSIGGHSPYRTQGVSADTEQGRSQCSTACSAEASCKFAVAQSGTCKLYGAVPTSALITNAYTFDPRLFAKTTASQRARFNMLGSSRQTCKKMVGKDIRKITALTHNVCRFMCSIEAGCVATDYKGSSRECWLKHTQSSIQSAQYCSTSNERLYGDVP